MLLSDLMDGAPEVEITALAYSSEHVQPGALFFCVPGFTADGHDFAPDAVERGAAALVCQRPLGLGVPEVLVEDVRAAMGPLAARFYGDPTAELRVVGITGTNGKTTTAFLVREILERAGIQTGLLGTVKRIVGGVEEDVERTTPEAIDLQATFRRMLDGGDQACAMEVSSHALELGRAVGIRYACKVFTNLTQDHLDFHESMESYFMAKRRLFHEPGPAVVNVDDDYGLRLADETPDAITYGIEADAEVRATDVAFDVNGSTFRVGELELRTTPAGPVQRVQRASRPSGRRARSASATPTLPPPWRRRGACRAASSRWTRARTSACSWTTPTRPTRSKTCWSAARELTEGRLHVVFGAGGDRDRGKRPLMGEVAARLADHVIVTSDNPRSEDPEAIVDEILAGAGPDVEREVDRRRAIARAIESAEPGDVVVIAGKGHEQGQEFEGGRKEPFDDVTVAREALQARLGART